MNNLRIRQAAAQAQVKLWEVATELEITDSTLSRKLRKELPAEEQERILTIIKCLKDGDLP